MYIFIYVSTYNFDKLLLTMYIHIILYRQYSIKVISRFQYNFRIYLEYLY